MVINSHASTVSLSELIDSCLVSEKEMQVQIGQFWYPIDVSDNKEMEEILNDCSTGKIWLQERDHYGGSSGNSRHFAVPIKLIFCDNAIST